MRRCVAGLRRSVAIVAGIGLLTACAGLAQTADPAGTALAGAGPASPDDSPADKVALALASAELSAASGDDQSLAHAVAILDGLGAKPMDMAAADPLPVWRARINDGQAPMRGRPLGPGYRQGSIAPGSSERIEQLFLAGQRARIALAAPGQAALELKVEDARAKAVCGRSGQPLNCQWVPLFTQRYTIEIANPGKRETRYYLVVE